MNATTQQHYQQRCIRQNRQSRLKVIVSLQENSSLSESHAEEMLAAGHSFDNETMHYTPRVKNTHDVIRS